MINDEPSKIEEPSSSPATSKGPAKEAGIPKQEEVDVLEVHNAGLSLELVENVS